MSSAEFFIKSAECDTQPRSLYVYLDNIFRRRFGNITDKRYIKILEPVLTPNVNHFHPIFLANVPLKSI